ncbi:RimK-like ATPgrasp N-terminal domain-containing protein [Pseudomonas aeruginosa]
MINLCRRLQVPRPWLLLLAARRGAWPPGDPVAADCISELARKSVYRLVLGDLDRSPGQGAVPYPYGSHRRFHPDPVFRPYRVSSRWQDLARQLFEAFPCPLLLVEFKRNRTWHIEGMQPGVMQQACAGPGRPLRQRPGRFQPADLAHAAFAQAVPLRPGDPPRPRRGVPAFRRQGAGQLRAGRPQPRHRRRPDRSARTIRGSPSTTRCSSARPPMSPITPTVSPRRPRAKGWW